ncbi:MAG TPA: chemotaxis protein CheW [Chloroflexota bacterium]|nr:chemotaxis protein CheW [Chloroflexota bacterium]
MIEDPILRGEEEQLVVFRLGDDYFAMLIASVNEIIRLQKITPVPKSPPFVEGVTNLRGRVITVIDLRKRFGIASREDAHGGRIIVVEHGDKLMGMMVDGVDEVLTVPADAIEAVDEMVVSVDSQFLTGIVRLEDRLIIMLDQEQVLTAGEVRELETMKISRKALKDAQAEAEDEEAGLLPSGSAV